MKVTIKIDDDRKGTMFLNFIKTLDYVEIVDTDIVEESEIHIPKYQQDEVNRRLQHLLENPDSALDFDQVMEELDKC